MKIALDLRDARFRQEFERLSQRDVKLAASWALNDTARDVQTHIQERVKVVFDRPTRWTQRAFGVLKGAKPNQLRVEFGERATHERRYYLRVQEFGGARTQTGTEKRLSLGSPLPMTAAIPTEYARLDASGNWSSGERNQVMAQLKVGRDVGYNSNETEASRKRSGKRRAKYFIPKHGLAPGVYRRDAPSDIPIRVLTFTEKMPKYTPRLGFHEETDREFWARLPEHMSRTLRRVVEKRG